MLELEIFKKSNGNLVKITLNSFKGQEYLHIREYKMDGDTGSWFPTKSGYALPAEEIDSIIVGLQEASSVYTNYCRNKEIEKQLNFEFEED